MSKILSLNQVINVFFSKDRACMAYAVQLNVTAPSLPCFNFFFSCALCPPYGYDDAHLVFLSLICSSLCYMRIRALPRSLSLASSHTLSFWVTSFFSPPFVSFLPRRILPRF